MINQTTLVETSPIELQQMLPLNPSIDRIEGILLKEGVFTYRDSGWNTNVPVVMGIVGVVIFRKGETVPCIMECIAHVNLDTSRFLTLVPLSTPSDPDSLVVVTGVETYGCLSVYEPCIQLANDVLRSEIELGLKDPYLKEKL